MTKRAREEGRRVVLGLLRIKDARLAFAAALIAVVLMLAAQTRAEALEAVRRTVLYVGAPAVSLPDVRQAGVTSRSYAESASARTLVALGFPPEAAREYAVRRTVASVAEPPPEGTEDGVTAGAALDAGATYLAQTGQDQEAGPDAGGEGELAGVSPVRPELGDGDVAVVEDVPRRGGPEEDPSAPAAHAPVRSSGETGVPVGAPVGTEDGELAYGGVPTAQEPTAEHLSEGGSPEGEPSMEEPYELLSSSPDDEADTAPDPGTSSQTGPISAGREQVPTTLAEQGMEQPSTGEEPTTEEDGFELALTPEAGDEEESPSQQPETSLHRQPQAYPTPRPAGTAEDSGGYIPDGTAYPPPREEEPSSDGEGHDGGSQEQLDEEYAVLPAPTDQDPSKEKSPTHEGSYVEQAPPTGHVDTSIIVSVEKEQPSTREHDAGEAPQDAERGGEPTGQRTDTGPRPGNETTGSPEETAPDGAPGRDGAEPPETGSPEAGGPEGHGPQAGPSERGAPEGGAERTGGGRPRAGTDPQGGEAGGGADEGDRTITPADRPPPEEPRPQRAHDESRNDAPGAERSEQPPKPDADEGRAGIRPAGDRARPSPPEKRPSPTEDAAHDDVKARPEEVRLIAGADNARPERAERQRAHQKRLAARQPAWGDTQPERRSGTRGGRERTATEGG